VSDSTWGSVYAPPVPKVKDKYRDPTPQDLEDIARLKAALPRTHVDCWPPFTDDVAYDGGAARICIDLEWDPVTGELWTVGIGNEDWVVQFNWRTLTERSREQLRTALVAEIARRPVVIQNADGDIRKLRANGFRISGPENFMRLDDPMLLHSVLHSEEEHTLEYLSLIHGVLPAHKHLQWVRGAESVYNAGDLVQTCAVMRALEHEADADPRAAWIYRSFSLPFLWIAIEGEEAGIRVTPGVPEKLFEKFDQKRKDATLLLQAYCGWPVNINSPDQIKHVFYNLEGLPVQRERGARYGEEGKATTNKEALAALRRMQGTEWDEDESPTLLQAWANILEGGNPALEAKYLFTGAQQAISHYIEPCMGVERIYPECKQHVQASGRHSYTGPAMQQFKGELETLVTPEPGYCWVCHDWSQIEVRILAAEANDTVYLEAFARGEDIHWLNTRAIFGPPGSKDLEELRRGFNKRFVFRIHYRGKAENAGNIPGTKALGLDEQRLVQASNKYLSAHPALEPYWAKVEAEAERTGIVRTFMGRPRRLTSTYQAARAREGSNMPMQGGVADIYVQTVLMVKAAAPWARLVYGAHDAQKWQVPVARKLEFLAIYAPIVEREFVINGLRIRFPASYKVKEAA
jgi:DNA polymerase I-like protein with 3'-5' exonuclease and polymerase domains